ncbi:MAG: hypothetical protein IH594_13450 [Bacteroidales bacterium]|nr:hypothetical protein [Bacteroidales bacterium]
MKKILLSVLLLFSILTSGFSQVPDAFNYQAVVRNSSGELIVNHNVSFRITILLNSETGTPVYVETHSATTNDFGLVSLKIGQGTFVSGAFSPDTWGSNLHFIKIEVDPAGGSSYTLVGTTQLLSVPYAFHAETANSSQWLNDNDDIYFSTGKVGIGIVPGADLRRFQVKGNSEQAIAGVNNSPNYGAIYAQNLGTGPAADFRNYLRIIDGSQGAGKVLTSDAAGTTSWQTPAYSPWTSSASDIYFSGGNVGIGTAPGNLFLLDALETTSYARMRLKSSISDAGFFIDRKNITNNGFLIFQTNSINTFYTGLLGNSNYRISTLSTSLNGLEVESNGDVNLSDELHATRTGTANMMPLAYGSISSTGEVYANSGNFTVSHPSAGKYEISITGESVYYQNYITTASLSSNIGFVRPSSVSNNLIIWTYNTSGVLTDMIFSFVVYKP